MQYTQLFVIITIFKSFQPEMIFGILVIIFLLFCTAIFSGTEIAFFSLSPAQLDEIKTIKSKKSKEVLKLLDNPKKLLATILVANTFINVGIIIISTYITYGLFNLNDNALWGFLIQVVLVTFIILLFGEIIPKIYSTHHSVKFALYVAKPIIFFSHFFYPFSWFLMGSTYIIDKRVTRKSHKISINELSKALDLTTNKDTPEQERKILKGIVKFGNIEVKEIMKSRVDVTAVEIKTDFKQLINIILESGYSRIPVYKENFDSIAGVLHIKDLLPYLDIPQGFKWQTLIRNAYFVPESKKINNLLEEFREKKIHMAIVVDEYGGTSGLLTLEDIMEEIVGEINDEFDIEDVVFSKLDENNFVFEGKTLLNDFYKITGVEAGFFDEVKGDSDTIAGLLLELGGKIPEKNEKIVFKNFIFTVEAADKRSIKRIKVTKNGISKNNTNEIE
ncbi:MAG: gliding motility-associated protein GldE [Bacteroidetes bacterium]|nr:gliding motility-associated protein GldE [Bacteroidota bacterium]